MGALYRPNESAPGAPGSAAQWTSSAKSGVGTAIGNKSRVWFTMSHGIFNEIYYPRIDQACVRDMGLIVTDGATYFSEEKRDAEPPPFAGWQMVSRRSGLVNTSRDGRYRIEKQIVTDPHRDTVLQQVRFHPAAGRTVRLSPLCAACASSWESRRRQFGLGGRCQCTPALFAQRDRQRTGTLCSAPWMNRSVGYVGSSDGWQDLRLTSG